MNVNPVVMAIGFIAVLVIGIFVGVYMKDGQTNQGRIDLNPFPKSCEYNGKTFKSGEGFQAEDNCNSCSCDDGQVMCTTMACLPSSN